MRNLGIGLILLLAVISPAAGQVRLYQDPWARIEHLSFDIRVKLSKGEEEWSGSS